uniref:Uncharacterized protein n=1 Tax=Physcomitrium patens TaxID=3218 RepID=A0A2K1KL38_PHYPA|nr:hypothetical protein PHYPA_008171 [Physcomitrium patens]
MTIPLLDKFLHENTVLWILTRTLRAPRTTLEAHWMRRHERETVNSSISCPRPTSQTHAQLLPPCNFTRQELCRGLGTLQLTFPPLTRNPRRHSGIATQQSASSYQCLSAVDMWSSQMHTSHIVPTNAPSHALNPLSSRPQVLFLASDTSSPPTTEQ